ncbi:MAG: hypothetical protein AAGA46_09005 [Cyanobacteria bacterium P01_F01_bin.13]
MPDENTLWIVAETEETEETVELEGRRDGTRDMGGGFGTRRTLENTLRKVAKRKRVSLDAMALKSQMNSLLAIVGDLFEQADAPAGLQLNEVELSVEINAEGQLSLVGNGGSLGNSGGITLTFGRPE